MGRKAPFCRQIARLIRLAKEGDMARLRKLIAGGCRLDRRTGLDPWMTPLDAASAAGNPECVEILLSGGAPLWVSSIYEAIKVDAEAVLHAFHRHDKEFYRSFSKDKDFCANPRLNRWLLLLLP